MDKGPPGKFLITGCARTGTSLTLLLMSYFKGLKIDPTVEAPPLLFKKHDVLKKPQGEDGLVQNKLIHPKRGPLFITQTLVDFIKQNIKLIVMVRNAKDVLVSKHANNKGKYWCTPQRWVNSVNQLLDCLSYVNENNLQNHLHIILYEDLTTNLASEINKLQKFVGLPISPTYKEFYTKPIGIDEPYRERYEATSEGNFRVSLNQTVEALNGLRPVEPNSEKWKAPEHRQRIHEVMSGPYGKQINSLLKKFYETDKPF